jgi:ribonuclease HI
MSDPLPHISIYTDGGADPNPGPGGWAAILLHPEKKKELSGGDPDTTNNRMELTAAIKALEALKDPCRIDFYTDSEYLRKGITEWIDGWKAHGWQSGKKPIKNVDLWKRLDALRQNHDIEWQWVKGHAGNEYNERADQLASAAIPREVMQVDPDAVQIYLRIAGPAKGTQGTCGWAAGLLSAEVPEIIQGAHRDTTVNGFTLYAVLQILEQIRPEDTVQFFTNNSYLFDGITKWVNGWRKGGWVKPEKFKSEWQQLDQLNQSREIKWVRHRDDLPEAFANLDKIAKDARDSS